MNKKNDFYYHTYQKIITWKKDYYHIKANSKEEADAAMKVFFQENELHEGLQNDNDLLLAPRWCDHGDYYEGDEDLLSYEDNGNRPTEELYDEECELLDDNTPIQIKRDIKLYNLFLNK